MLKRIALGALIVAVASVMASQPVRRVVANADDIEMPWEQPVQTNPTIA